MNSSLPDAFLRHLLRLCPEARSQRFLVACSGGLDSTVLATLCRRCGMQFGLAHMNYGLRGGDSDEDAAFVTALAERWEVPCYTTAEPLLQETGIQEGARSLRYAWLEEVRTAHHYDLILTAHQGDDQIETVLLHFFRGAGPEALAGMPLKTELARGLRPLLPFRKAELRAFAEAEGIPWREDRSNAQPDYTRNALRLQVIPALQEIYPGLEATLLRQATRYEAIGRLYRFGVEDLRRRLVKEVPGGWRIPVKELAAFRNEALVYELFRPFGFGSREAEGIFLLLGSPAGRYLANREFTVVRHRAWLLVSRVTAGEGPYPVEQGGAAVQTRGGTLSLKLIDPPKDLRVAAHTALINADRLAWPLLLRRWKTGDYFYPLGLRKKKKVGRFFIDLKIPKGEKEQAWILESGGCIIWVVGHRIDDRFKVTPGTSKVLQLSWKTGQ